MLTITIIYVIISTKEVSKLIFKYVKLSRGQRRFLGLPLGGPLLLNEVETQIARQRLAERGIAAQEQGDQAEKRFLKAWSDPKHYPSWIVSVRKATDHEDHDEATDAVITTNTGEMIRIQIKSGRVGIKLSKRHWIKGIAIVLVLPKHNDWKIRQRTIGAINAYENHKARLAARQ